MQEAPPKTKNDESIAFEAYIMQNIVPRNKEQALDGRPLLEPEGFYFPSDSHETDDRAKRILVDLQRQREQKSRVQNPSLLLDDLRELGTMASFQRIVAMSFYRSKKYIVSRNAER